jgi:hypothetical protein
MKLLNRPTPADVLVEAVQTWMERHELHGRALATGCRWLPWIMAADVEQAEDDAPPPSFNVLLDAGTSSLFDLMAMYWGDAPDDYCQGLVDGFDALLAGHGYRYLRSGTFLLLSPGVADAAE